jgi:hypothetical protein
MTTSSSMTTSITMHAVTELAHVRAHTTSFFAALERARLATGCVHLEEYAAAAAGIEAVAAAAATAALAAAADPCATALATAATLSIAPAAVAVASVATKKRSNAATAAGGPKPMAGLAPKKKVRKAVVAPVAPGADAPGETGVAVPADGAVPTGDTAPVSDAVVPDAVAPNAVVPDAVAPNAVVPDAAPVPNAVVPDAVAPNAIVPDAAPVPDAAVPDAAVPDAAPVPDAVVPDAAAGESSGGATGEALCADMDDSCNTGAPGVPSPVVSPDAGGNQVVRAKPKKRKSAQVDASGEVPPVGSVVVSKSTKAKAGQVSKVGKGKGAGGKATAVAPVESVLVD